MEQQMQFIEDQKHVHAVSLVCKAKGISQSRYYRWVKSVQQPCGRKLADEELRRQIVGYWQQSRKNYGSPRILADFRKQGIAISRKRIARLMRQDGIQGRYNRRRKPLATNSEHDGRISTNELKHIEHVHEAGEAVVTDTTYIWTDSGWHYLATVMDLYNREIIGWAFSNNNDSGLVCKALSNAAVRLKKQQHCLHHSDRGSTYCSDKYLKLLNQLELKSSMSAKGYCYDNAYMESFYGTLKCECDVLDMALSPEETRLAVFDYIEGFYNPHRNHTSLGGMSPVEYRKTHTGSTPINIKQNQSA